jgi:hypothetical protein
MGIAYNTSIVTDGLVFSIDPANSRCYSGSGNTAFGLIDGTGNTLTNGVGFGTTNSGYFIFDGTNDNIPFTISNFNNILSVEIWMKMKLFNGGMPFGFSLYDVWTADGRIGFNTAQGDQYGISSTQVTNLGLLNQWKHYVFEMRSDVSYTNNKIYINSQNQSLSQLLGSEGSSNRNFNNGSGRISSWLNDNNYNIPMDLGQFRIYNRALSSQEIAQNFNATRDRYGI